VQDAGRHEPAGAGLETVGLAVVEDAVIALAPALEAAAEVFLRGPGLETEERVREVVADGVQLGWKIIGLGFTLLSHQCSLGIALVHVVRDGAEVVEELAVNRPALILFPNCRTHRLRPIERDGVRSVKTRLPSWTT